MGIEVRPATRFADVRTMVGPKRPDANVCWCLSYRLTSSKENQSLTGPERGERVKRLCRQTAPGGARLRRRRGGRLGGRASARRHELRHAIAASRTSTTSTCGRCGASGCGPDTAAAASRITCSRARSTFARHNGAPAIEGYPVDNHGEKVDLTMAYVGTRALFEKAGFTKAADTDSVLNGFPRVLDAARPRLNPRSRRAGPFAKRMTRSRSTP